MKKKKCSFCQVFVETTIKYNGKQTCLNCLDKLYISTQSHGIYTKPKQTRVRS